MELRAVVIMLELVLGALSSLIRDELGFSRYKVSDWQAQKLKLMTARGRPVLGP
jgi:hypothetical protein